MGGKVAIKLIMQRVKWVFLSVCFVAHCVTST